MSTIDLSQYGITGAQVIHNPSYDQLFIDEVKPGLEGYEKGQETELGAVNVGPISSMPPSSQVRPSHCRSSSS